MSDDDFSRHMAYMSMEGLVVVDGMGLCPTDPEIGSDAEGRRGLLIDIQGVGYETGKRGSIITLWSLEYLGILFGTALAQIETLGTDSAEFFTKVMTEAQERHRKELGKLGPIIGTMLSGEAANGFPAEND